MTSDSKPPIVVGMGELLWDCFPGYRRPGGAPANVAFHANQLGFRGIVCSRVGQDPAGDELVDFLTRQGLTSEYVQRDGQLETGRVSVDMSVPGSPSYVIHENVAWDTILFDSGTQSLMGRAAAVCFGSLAQRSVRSRDAIQKCLAATTAGCLRVFDVNLRQSFYDRDVIEESMLAADIVKLNGDELAVLTHLLKLPSASPRDFADALRTRYRVSLTCVTRAEDGCLLIDKETAADVPGREVDVVDAVGAGDAFTAALIAARLWAWPLRKTAEYADAVGSLVTTHSGAMPALGPEFAALKRAFTQ